MRFFFKLVVAYFFLGHPVYIYIYVGENTNKRRCT